MRLGAARSLTNSYFGSTNRTCVSGYKGAQPNCELLAPPDRSTSAHAATVKSLPAERRAVYYRAGGRGNAVGGNMPFNRM